MSEAQWFKDAQVFGAGSGSWCTGGGMSSADIERRVAEALGLSAGEHRTAEAIGAHSDVLHRLATHEAGHAIVARVLGLPLRAVEIDLRHGGVNRFHGDQAPVDWSATDDAAILMAGAIAERMALPATSLEGCEDDESALLTLMSQEHALDVQWARATAEAILDQNRGDHERLVDALVRRRRLTGDEVDELLDGAEGDEFRGFIERMTARIRAGLTGRDPVLLDNGVDVTHEVRGVVQDAVRSGGDRSIVRAFEFTESAQPGRG